MLIKQRFTGTSLLGQVLGQSAPAKWSSFTKSAALLNSAARFELVEQDHTGL